MLLYIFSHEVKYWLRRPSFYVYAFIFLGVAFLAFSGTAGLFDPSPSQNVTPQFFNSPFEINYFIQYLNKFFLFLLPVIVGASLYKDYKDSVHSLLYSYPIRKQDYLLGKFLGASFVACAIPLLVGLVIALAEHLPGLHSDKIGPFNVIGYVQALFVYTVPNMLFYGAIIFTIVMHFRNIYAGFVAIIVLFLVQNITQNVGSDFFIALLDPFAENAAKYQTRFWTLEDKNTKLLPVLGTVLYNRIFWLVIASVIFGYAYKKFSFSEHGPVVFPKWRSQKEDTGSNFDSSLHTALPKVGYGFTWQQQSVRCWKLSNIDFWYIVKSWMFYVIVFFGLFAVLFAVGKVTNNSDMALLPVTHVVLTIPAFFFTTIIMLLTFIFSGMLIHRDRTSKMNQLVDSTPTPSWVFLASKVMAVLKMQVLLLCIMMIAGLIIQIYNGYYNFEIGLYLLNLFVIQFIGLIIWAFASVFVHTLFRNIYLGMFILLMGWLGISGLNEVGVETRLLLFNFSEPMEYSDLNKYGGQLKAFFVAKGYWLVFGLLLVTLSYLFWFRGYPENFKERLQLAKMQLHGPIRIITGVLLLLFVVFGATIQSEENRSQELPSKMQEKAFGQFEETFGVYANMTNQPKVTSIRLKMDLFPTTYDFTATGTYTLVNKSSKTIDTLLVKTGFDEITEYSFDRYTQLIQADDYVHFSVWKLGDGLQPNDSMKLHFSMKNKEHTLFERTSDILHNGTFIKNDILPRMGYFLGRAVRSPEDSTSRKFNYYTQDADFIEFKATMSTEIGQKAIAPGYLINQWEEKGRAYFEYQTRSKIKNSLSFSSGNYQITKEEYKGVDLEIYHHKNHTHNLSSMINGLKASLDYNTDCFGAYPFKEARIIEFPITEGTYASVMANSIPTSEMRFIANTSHEKIDISFYTMAHELTHQWWGNQVVPADALGAVMLSESITEYISLHIYGAHYGEEAAFRFLKMQRERYLRGRTRESSEEPPLVFVEGAQQYLSYAKGAMVFNAISQYIGKEKLDDVLKEFLDDYKYKAAPYPTSIELVERIERATPDSLRYLIEDMFESVMFYDNVLNDVKVESTHEGNYQMSVDFSILKYRDDDATKEEILNDYIEIGFYNLENELIYIERVKITDKKNNIVFELNEKPIKIMIDPNYLLIDKNMKDNQIKLQNKNVVHEN